LLADSCYTPQPEPKGRCCAVSGYSPGVNFSETNGNLFGGESWPVWSTLLSGFYGLPMDEAELVLFQHLTALPGSVQESLLGPWLAVGRRGGKSQIAALVAVYEAEFKDYTPSRS
jgi:hypothetical protein